MIKKLQIFQSVKLHGCGRYYEDEYKSNFKTSEIVYYLSADIIYLFKIQLERKFQTFKGSLSSSTY